MVLKTKKKLFTERKVIVHFQNHGISRYVVQNESGLFF